MVWLPRRLSPSESSFYSSVPERLCIFANGSPLCVVQTTLFVEMDYKGSQLKGFTT